MTKWSDTDNVNSAKFTTLEGRDDRQFASEDAQSNIWAKGRGGGQTDFEIRSTYI